jgi:outer membrane protein TolC
MIKRILLGLGAAALVLASARPALTQQASQPSPASSDQKTLKLSIEDCILKALKYNLQLQVQVLNPEQSDLAITQAGETFIPSLSFGYSKRNTAAASYSFLDSGGTTTQAQSSYSAQINQNLPTGGVILASLTSYSLDSNANFQTINPRYGSTLTFNFSQPLLKNFGFDIARQGIIIARNNRDISDLQFKKFLEDKIYEVEQDYWNLVYAIENLKVQQQSLQLAKELLEKNQRSVEIGTMAPIEVLSAQAEVAAREADILGAAAQVKVNEDTLRTVMNLEAEVPGAEKIRLLPSSVPTSDPRDVSLESTFQSALDNRPDLAASKVDIKNKEFNLTIAKNQLLPDLSLNAQYWSPGVSGTQLIYLNNNPLTGVIIGSLPGGAASAFKDTFNFKYKNWSVGLTLNIPLSSVFSRAAQAEARVILDQALLNLKDQQQQLFLALSNATLAVQTNYKRVQAYRASRELAQKKVEAELERLRVGLSTNYIVLQYQRDLATQQGLELKAIIDYNLSLANLETAEGLSLKNKKIEISDWLKR